MGRRELILADKTTHSDGLPFNARASRGDEETTRKSRRVSRRNWCDDEQRTEQEEKGKARNGLRNGNTRRTVGVGTLAATLLRFLWSIENFGRHPERI